MRLACFAKIELHVADRAFVHPCALTESSSGDASGYSVRDSIKKI